MNWLLQALVVVFLFCNVTSAYAEGGGNPVGDILGGYDDGFISQLGDKLGNIGDLLDVDAPPKTCDPGFWNMIKARAWEEGNREVIQNANLLAKPDSVLTYSCFDHHMNHISRYAHDNYPGHPHLAFSESLLGPEWFFYLHQEVMVDEMIDGGLGFGRDPYLKEKVPFGAIPHGMRWAVDLRSVLELLILDTMVSDVTELGKLATTDDMILTAADILGFSCSRGWYFEGWNFNHAVLGGRGSIGNAPAKPLSLSSYGCDRMAAVWNQARCYNAVTRLDHDNFYTLQPDTRPHEKASYISAADTYRPLPKGCPAPSQWLPDLLSSNPEEAACNLYFHGTPTIPIVDIAMWELIMAMTSPPPDAKLGWGAAYDRANPAPGGAGATQPMPSYLPLVDPAICNTYTPIKTGVVVRLNDGTTYDDAYCMAPGCWYNHASPDQCQSF